MKPASPTADTGSPRIRPRARGPLPERPLIAVLAGGYSAERTISLQSGEEVAAHLGGADYEAVLVDVGADGWFAGPGRAPVDLSDFSFAGGGERRLFDAAFVAIHGTPGEDGLLAGYLEMLGIPHTASDTRASALTFDKDVCKDAVRNTGVRLPVSVKVRAGKRPHPDPAGLRFPLFVKPNRNGSSCGITRVDDAPGLETALEAGFAYDDELLVEERVEGTEVTCGVYTRKGRPVALPLCEVVSGAGHAFFDYVAKYTAGEADEIIPARLPGREAALIRDLSLRIYDLLGLRGLVRADYMLRAGEAWFLEVNTVPGLSGASIAPKMARAAGMNLETFYGLLMDEALRPAEAGAR